MREYKWCAIDAEGDVGNKGLLGVAFYSDIMQQYLTDHNEIKRELLVHAAEGYTFLAHNAQYDIPVIFWQLDIAVKTIYFNGRFNRGEWRYNNNMPKAEIWDTLALSGGLSLAKLGDALQVPKYPTPQKLLGIEPDQYKWKCEKHDEWECETCYAVRDAEIAYRFMTDLTSQLASWSIQPKRRISNLAVSVWRQLDKPDPIKLPTQKVKELARDSYHGGRVETFKLGKLPNVHAADVASMYPSILARGQYPSPDDIIYMERPALSYFPDTGDGTIECDITMPAMHVPPLPYNDRGVIKYPVGRIFGTWAISEVRYAMSLGATLNRISKLAYSTKLINPFDNFVGTLWEMRRAYEAANDPRSLFAKLLMNNLYGRLGVSDRMEQRDIYPCDINRPLSKQPKTWWYDSDRKLYLVYERERSFGGEWANVMWAAETTARARIALHQYILQQGDSIIYCDTDSVFSTMPIVGMGEGLGALRGAVSYEEMIVAAPKVYALKEYEYNMPDSWRTEPCRKHKSLHCDDCRWFAKAKGVRRDMALQFMREGIVSYSQPIKPSSQGIRKIKAGTWVPIEKVNHGVPHRRHPTNQQALDTGIGYSDTEPPHCGVKVL